MPAAASAAALVPMPPAASSAAGTLVGGSLASYASCFSSDDKLLCVPCGRAVRLFSVRTGEQVGVLAGAPGAEGEADPTLVRADGSHAGHTRTVTCVLPHPSNRVQLYTAALDGTVKLWDLYDQSCVATYSVRIAGGGEEGERFDRPPITHMVRGAADLLYLLVDPHLDAASSSTSTAAAASSSSSTSAAAAAAPAAAATAAAPSERACRIVLYALSKRSCFILYKVKACTALALDPSHRILAALSGHTLRLYDTASRRSKSTFKKVFPHRLSTVTFHPSDPYITLGDEQGHILVLYGYQQSQQAQAAKPSDSQLVTQTLHWHAHRVGAVLFTQDGHYMLSGGEEGVLVIWQLETGTKQFIPRLASNILHMALSHDGNTYALSLGDNRIKFVSAVSNRVEKIIAGLSYSAPSAGSASSLTTHTAGSTTVVSTNGAGVVTANTAPRSVRIPPTDPSRQLFIPFLYSPTHHGWFLNSILHPGALQLYDVFADRHLMDADLLQRNVISRTEGGDEGGHGGGGSGSSSAANAHQPRIEQAVLNPRGDKMATLERRSGAMSSGVAGVAQASGSNNDSTILKFWEWSSSSSSWVLNTRIEPPHSHATAHQALVGLLWHPQENMVVSIGRDHCFRVWREISRPRAPNVRKEHKSRNAPAEDEGEEVYWNCTGVGHYKSYPTSGGAFSSDGSLLAIAYGQVLTLWDPQVLTLKHTLLHPSPATPIRFLHFIPHTPFLLTTTARAVYVWNLLTLSLWWSFDLRVISVATCEPSLAKDDKGHFALMVLQPDEDDPETEAQAATAASGSDAQAQVAPRSFRRRQTHLLLFSVHSPVPLRAWPLRDARLETVHIPGSSSASSSALSGSQHTTGGSSSFSSPIFFASDPALLRAAASAGGKRASAVPTSLVYINYKRQLVRLDDVFNEAETTAAAGSSEHAADAHAASAMARLHAQSEEISMFEQLYGKAHRPSARTPSFGATPAPALPSPSSSSALPTLTPSGSSSLAALLNAPSHILPPPSSLFTAVMDGLLARSAAQASAEAASAAQAQRDARQAQAQAQLQEDEDARMADEEADEVSADLGAHASVAALDAALLATDSVTLSGGAGTEGGHDALFHWSSHPHLSAHFGALVARMHDASEGGADDLLREVELAPAAASVSAADATAAPASKESKRSKKHAAAAGDSTAAASSVSSKSDKKASSRSKPSPALKAAAGDADSNGVAAMDLDDGDDAQEEKATTKKKSKSSKSKH